MNRGRCSRKFLRGALAAGLALAARSAVAQPMEVMGTRASGMGGAFVAVADDGTGPYWNPAGLATGAVLNLLVDRQAIELQADVDTRDRPARAARGSGLLIGLTTPPLGLTYYRLRSSHVIRPAIAGQGQAASGSGEDADGSTLGSLVTHHAVVTVLQSLGDHLVVGSAFKYVRGIAAVAPVPERFGHAEELLDEAGALIGKASNALDLDVGVMASFGQVRAGLVGRNLRQPEFPTTDGVELRLKRHVRTGLAVFPRPGMTASADLDLTKQETPCGPRRDLAFGLEQWLGGIAGVRGGFRLDLEGAAPVGTVGLSVAILRFLWVEAQVTRGTEDRENGWGFGTRLAF